MDCWLVESSPKNDGDVIWGKKIIWISKDGFFTIKTESYDEDMYLVKTEIASKIKTVGGKKLPTHIEVIPADTPGNKTLVDINDISFDKKIEDSFFSQQNMKRIR